MLQMTFNPSLRQAALTNFMALNSGRLSSALNNPVFQQLSALQQNSFSFAQVTFVWSQGANLHSGFLMPPPGRGLGLAQLAAPLNNMRGMWNVMGAFLSGALRGQFQIPGNFIDTVKAMLRPIANMLNTLMPHLQLGQLLNQVKLGGINPNANISLGQLPDLPGKMPGKPASFPGIPASDFLNTLPTNNPGAVARRLNVSGRRDVNIINQVVSMLKTDKPKITPGVKKGGRASLPLSAADVQAIRNAGSLEEAKKIIYKAISKKTGINIDGIDMNNRIKIRSSKARQVLNKLLGTRVRPGVEKNSASSLILDSMVESIAKSIRAGSFGTTKFQAPATIGFGGMFGTFGMGAAGGFPQMANELGFETPGGQPNISTGIVGTIGSFGVWMIPGETQEIPNPATGVTVDLSDYIDTANKGGELASPLIFDLEGTGLELKNPEMIEVDIDGDGKLEMITDIDAELGLLVFDSKGDGLENITGADMFGDNTDLSKYGIIANTPDGRFKDGFQALRAVCEHFGLISENKQYLDEKDLAFLEDKIGLRMRVGGIVEGEDRRFHGVGVTRINLGNPDQTQHLEDAPEDRWGNKIIFQDGATFIVNGEERKYADIWFKIQARYDDAPAKENLSISKVELMFLR